ncbi:MBL fold metallo-hydrolase [Vallicoccus soli]|uniref:MBL fold metallo-hydrolase n=2 Tax=Vallicoccus soli TaxID=2339232 RepID=A0A3A3ZN92_9ACTN|nr:MBL fold metallo-hydrolase [Vallicoccus soli]
MTLEGTNTWVLGTAGGVVVVDPGPLHEEHLRRVAAHGPVLRTVLTHGHPDHAEGARRFAALTGAPVLARDPALALDGPALAAGPLPLDAAPGAAPPGLDVEVLLTPGHTADSVCLLVRGPDGARALLTGDTVLGRGTTVVAHPDGRLGDYLASLRRLAALGPLPVLPGHGPPRPDAGAAARAYLAHREQRLAEVRAALAAGARTPAEVVAAVYPDLPAALRPAAERTVRAALVLLGQEGLSASGA